MFMHMIQLTTNLLKKLNNLKSKMEEKHFDVVKGTDMILIHTEWNEYRGIDLKKLKN